MGDAGASSLGYYGGAWGPDGASIVAHGFTGALHLWRRSGDLCAYRMPPWLHSTPSEMCLIHTNCSRYRQHPLCDMCSVVDRVLCQVPSIVGWF